MSQNSSKQNYQATQEWLEWAKARFSSLKKRKRKPRAMPRFVEYDK
jgi:hypothetical protein